MKVDFIFDVASPNAYFVHKIIPEFESRTGAVFNYIPCLLGGIMHLTNNKPPFIAFSDVESKMKYQMLEMDRFIKKHKLVDFKFNSSFPMKTVAIQRGAIAAKELDVFDDYLESIFSAIWEKNIDMANEDTFFETLKTDGLDDLKIKEIISSQACKDKLIKNTQNAVDNGVFGIPTFIYANEIFFGKDHLDQLEDALKA
ncbi:2-hydroxychromene-2-carboxylate isomerase [Gammaproteobacteria bacterium]|nr:2-hydroxychromene-2-carboxylate isomerase [Gammaproteobacteria bacterium]